MSLLDIVRPESAKTELREIIAGKEAKRRIVEEERAKIKHLEDVAEAANAASRKAREAKAQSDAARKRWIMSGCSYSATLEHHELEQAALEAKRAAEVASADAGEVLKTLPRARDALNFLESQLRGWDDSINAAKARCLVEECAALLERGPKLADELRAWRIEVKALQAAVEPGDDSLDSNRAFEIVERSLQRAEIKSWYAEREATRGYEIVHERPEPVGALLKERIAHYRNRAAVLMREILNGK